MNKTENMIWIPGGIFTMGSDHHYPEEAPAHKASVEGFWMDAHTVTVYDLDAFL
jgi:formylglycine-generating enzyme required for sulfatase activity